MEFLINFLTLSQIRMGSKSLLCKFQFILRRWWIFAFYPWFRHKSLGTVLALNGEPMTALGFILSPLMKQIPRNPGQLRDDFFRKDSHGLQPFIKDRILDLSTHDFIENLEWIKYFYVEGWFICVYLSCFWVTLFVTTALRVVITWSPQRAIGTPGGRIVRVRKYIQIIHHSIAKFLPNRSQVVSSL